MLWRLCRHDRCVSGQWHCGGIPHLFGASALPHASSMWTVPMELAAGTATKLSTMILVPAWTKNWTICQSISSLAHSWLLLNCKSGRTLTSSIHHHHLHHHIGTGLMGLSWQQQQGSCISLLLMLVFSQRAEDGSFPEELWLTSARWTPTTVWTFLNWRRTRRVCVTFRYWL